MRHTMNNPPKTWTETVGSRQTITLPTAVALVAMDPDTMARELTRVWADGDRIERELLRVRIELRSYKQMFLGALGGQAL